MGLWALLQTPRTLPTPLLILASFLTKETRWASQVAWWWRNLPASAGDARVMGWIPGSGRFLGQQNGNPLQYSCLENSMDGGAWQATVHGAVKSQTRLSNWAPTHTETRYCNRDFQQPSHTLPHSPPALSPGSNSLILSKKNCHKLQNTKRPRQAKEPKGFTHLTAAATSRQSCPPLRPHRRQPTRLPFLGFFRQEHWSGVPFPSPVHESEKSKWSCSSKAIQ